MEKGKKDLCILRLEIFFFRNQKIFLASSINKINGRNSKFVQYDTITCCFLFVARNSILRYFRSGPFCKIENSNPSKINKGKKKKKREKKSACKL